MRRCSLVSVGSGDVVVTVDPKIDEESVTVDSGEPAGDSTGGGSSYRLGRLARGSGMKVTMKRTTLLSSVGDNLAFAATSFTT